jgi:homoserine dehydrogenase
MLDVNREAITSKIGAPVEVVKIGIRDLNKPRAADRSLFTDDLRSIVDDPEIEVILELMGGLEPAGMLVERALHNGKHVVTANKELLAKKGAPLIRLASERGLDLHFEAAAGGGIPLIQPLRHQLSGNDVLGMKGILNGTTNVILTRMSRDGVSLATALKEAQDLGYAEADPSADVDGHDAQYKLAILAGIAFCKEVPPETVYREGIRSITAEDIYYANILGYTIKLLAIVDALKDDAILARVHPTLIPKHHPLASVNGVYNALWVRGDFVGDLMFSGRGAGAEATGSAVVGDLIDVCRNIRLGGAGNTIPWETNANTRPIEELETAYYVRLVVRDRPMVLGEVATIFGRRNVSLSAMEMKVIDVQGKRGEIAFLTHVCLERDFRQAINDLRDSDAVISIENWIRVEE